VIGREHRSERRHHTIEARIVERQVLGVGLDPSTPSWGTMLNDGRDYLLTAWWIATMPGIFLAVALTSINLMGSALEKARNRIYGGL